MQKMTVYTKAALDVLKQGGFMRSEKQRDGSILVRLYNAKSEKLNGHYNEVQIVLDGRGLLNGAIILEGNNHVCEWTYWDPSQVWDFDPRSTDNNIYA